MPLPAAKTLEFLYKKFIGDDPGRIASYEDALFNVRVADHLVTAREEAELSQIELAKRVGCNLDFIQRLEAADVDELTWYQIQPIFLATGHKLTVGLEKLPDD